MKLRSERIKAPKQTITKQEPRVQDQSSGSSSSSSSSSQSSPVNIKKKENKRKELRKTEPKVSDTKKSESTKKKNKQQKIDVKSQEKSKSKSVKKEIHKQSTRQLKQIKVQSRSETPDKKKQKEVEKLKSKKPLGKNKNDSEIHKNNIDNGPMSISDKNDDRPYQMEDLSSDQQPEILQNRRTKQQRQLLSNPIDQDGMSKLQLRQSLNQNDVRNNQQEQSMQFEDKIYQSCVNFAIQIEPVYPLRILFNSPILLSLNFQYKDYEDGKWKFRRICPSMINTQNTGITQFPSEHLIQIINEENGNKMIERKKIMELNLKGVNMARLQRQVDRANELIKNPKTQQIDLNYWGIANKNMLQIIARLLDESQKELRSEIEKIIQDSGIDCYFQNKNFYSKGLSQDYKGMLVTQSQQQQQKLRKENLMRVQLHFKQYRKIQDCGSSSFKTLRENGYFVDKSLLIRDIILDPSKYILISKPHRWGKTVNLDMLQVFFDGSGDRYKQYENRKIFEGNLKLLKEPKKIGAQSELNIINTRINGRSVVEQYQGKYIAIKITIQPIQTTAYQTFKSIMAQTYRKFIPFQQEQQEIKSSTISAHSFAQSVAARNCEQFQKILNKQGTEQETIDSLRRLINIMVEHYNRKVILLIDEINQFSHLQNKEKHQQLMNFLYNMLTVKVLSDPSLSDNIFKLLIMGQTPLTFKNLGLLKICEPDENRYNHYFGFSDSQMSHLAKRYLRSVGNDLIFYQTMLLRHWYGGFPIDNDNENRLYNPASIISAIALQQIKPYCATKQNICIIEQCLNRSNKCKQMLLQLLCNDKCKISDRQLNLQKICLSSRIIEQYGKSLLYHYGFVVKDCKINRNGFRIPNTQIRTFLQWKLQAMYGEIFQKDLSYQRYLDNLSDKSFVLSQIINDLCENLQKQFSTFESLKLILENPDTIADIFCMQPTYRAKGLPGHPIKILIPTDEINPIIITAYKHIDNDDGLADKMSESMWQIYGRQCLESALEYCIQNQIIVDNWIFRVVGLYSPLKNQSGIKIWKSAVMQHELFHRQVQKASNYMKNISPETQHREPEIKMIDIVVKEQEDFAQIPRNKKKSALQLKKLYEFLLSEELSVPEEVDDIEEYGKRRKLQ